MQKDASHIEMRNKVAALLNNGCSLENIASRLNIPIGTRYIKNSVSWYKYCLVAMQNQKKAIEKHPNLYSKAGKIAQEKHPWICIELGKKYGSILGKKRAESLKGNRDYFSLMAKRLQEINPAQSRSNMLKAHNTMKKKGTFNIHQRYAALKCMEKNPLQLKSMSKKAHALYPLALLALESKRKNYPYEFISCLFDSDSERKCCEVFVRKGLFNKPEEGKNVHFRIGRHHVDFFINNKVFVEFHPPRQYGNGKGETTQVYYTHKREILNNAGYSNYPLIVIDSLKEIDSKIEKIKGLIPLELDQ